MSRLDEKDVIIVNSMISELYDLKSFKSYIFDPRESHEWHECNKQSCSFYHFIHPFTQAFASIAPEKRARFTWYVIGKNMGDELSQSLPDNPRVVLGGAASEYSPFLLMRFLEKLNNEREKQNKPPLNPTLTVIDICKTPLNRLKRALKHYNGNVKVNTIHDSLSQADLEDNSQDLFTSDLIWAWIDKDEREACLENVHRFLKPGGSIAVREMVYRNFGSIPPKAQKSLLEKFEGNIDHYLEEYFGKDVSKDPSYNKLRAATVDLKSEYLAKSFDRRPFNSFDEILNFFGKYSTIKAGKIYTIKLGDDIVPNLILVTDNHA